MLAAPLLFAIVAPAGAAPPRGDRGPDLSEAPNLVVPAGNKVSRHLYAESFQVYRWDGARWNFVAPEALLFADAGLSTAQISTLFVIWSVVSI